MLKRSMALKRKHTPHEKRKNRTAKKSKFKHHTERILLVCLPFWRVGNGSLEIQRLLVGKSICNFGDDTYLVAPFAVL
ncbi:hypothetical protein V2J09_008471 [Rumex salicifolius]